MTVKTNLIDIKEKKKVGMIFRLFLVVIALFVLSYGLGVFTVFLSNVSTAAAFHSMGEFIAGFGTIFFGLFTLISVAAALATLGFWLYGFFDTSVFGKDND